MFFTARGICQAIFTFSNHSGGIGAILNGNSSKENWYIVLEGLKQSHFSVLDIILMALCGFIVIHAIIGVYYAISTDFNAKKMFNEKFLIYLQILSSFAAVFVVMALMRPAGEIMAHSLVYWIFTALVAVLGSFHMANGFSNACITLGIRVSNETKLVVNIFAWIIAIVSMLQIVILLV